MGSLEILPHPVVVPERLRLTETAGGTSLKPHVVGAATAAPAAHMCLITRMESVLSRHRCSL